MRVSANGGTPEVLVKAAAAIPGKSANASGWKNLAVWSRDAGWLMSNSSTIAPIG